MISFLNIKTLVFKIYDLCHYRYLSSLEVSQLNILQKKSIKAFILLLFNTVRYDRT